MKNHADLVGKPIGREMLDELNRRLKAVRPSPVSDETGSLDVTITEAAAMVCGTKPENAYLQLELIAQGFEYSPLLVFATLKGAKKSTIGDCDKTFMTTIRSESRNVILGFCRELASLLTFVGPDRTLEDSLIATLCNKSMMVSDMQFYVFDSVKHGTTFLVELATDINVSRQIVVTIYQDNSSAIGDLYDEIDSSLYGDVKNVLDYELKAEIIYFCKRLSMLCYPSKMSIFDVAIG